MLKLGTSTLSICSRSTRPLRSISSLVIRSTGVGDCSIERPPKRLPTVMTSNSLSTSVDEFASRSSAKAGSATARLVDSIPVTARVRLRNMHTPHQELLLHSNNLFQYFEWRLEIVGESKRALLILGTDQPPLPALLLREIPKVQLA